MKQFLYVMPAVLICMLYALLAALAGGISGFQPIAFVYSHNGLSMYPATRPLWHGILRFWLGWGIGGEGTAS